MLGVCRKSRSVRSSCTDAGLYEPDAADAAERLALLHACSNSVPRLTVSSNPRPDRLPELRGEHRVVGRARAAHD